ncbi:MAG TPA: PfkB family carbohydrate kinase [Armatimonadota bacterium]|nr:PfkB family carbohydrate kinase [Armatimonadota bacterium]
MSSPHIVVFGPAYLDRVLESAQPLQPIADAPSLDQSLIAARIEPLRESLVCLSGPSGDSLVFHLPEENVCPGMRVVLNEPVLARIYAGQTPPCVTGQYTMRTARLQLGGMGAGYAKACHGRLCAPFGDDETGNYIQKMLKDEQVQVSPIILPGHASDTSLIILGPRGEKLAVGVRDALLHWTANDEEYALAENARALIFCGAPNTLAANIITRGVSATVMFAPNMRNIDEVEVPLTALAPSIHYLAMNALEWAHLRDQQTLLQTIPLISITNGAHGSHLYICGRRHDIPAHPHPAPRDTNRAGETYGATLFKAILTLFPTFPQGQFDDDALCYAAMLASREASRQLDITSFDFPPDTWMQDLRTRYPNPIECYEER